MNSERIKAIANDIFPKDIVLDVGCDHGYLSIYLKKNNLCQEVYASEISPNALESARKNFQKYQVQIDSFLADGFKDIPVSFNTAVLAGMGTNTILKILDDKNTPNKLVIASNNEPYKLRKNLHKLGYKLVDEKIVLENNHYYIIILAVKGKQRLNRAELRFGISNDEDYYKYLQDKNKEIYPKVPLNKKIKLLYENWLLKGLIEKK